MNFNAIDITAALGYIAGGGLTAVLAAGGPKWTAAGPAIIAVAGLLRVMFNKTGAPATSIVADAPVVDKGGNQVALNVSSTTTLFQPKGPTS